MAAAALGLEWEREQRRGKRSGESERVPGDGVARVEKARTTREAGGGEARVCAPRAHALLPTGRRLKTVGVRRRWAGPSWAGPVGPPGGLHR